jgi:hypothetical protein
VESAAAPLQLIRQPLHRLQRHHIIPQAAKRTMVGTVRVAGE